MAFAASYFDGRTSAARDVEVELYRDGRLTVVGPGLFKETRIAQIEISARIGNAPRRIAFADGSICETAHNDLLDGWLEHLGAHSSEHRVFRLERRWRYAALALVITVAGTAALLRYGLPAAADHAARVLPRSIDTAIGEGGLQTLDSLFFEPSRLSMAQQARLHARFDSMQQEMNTGIELRLELRAGGAIGPNAFALPSGIVIVTDELVQIAEHPEEIDGVLAHEIGHVVHRHSLRMLLQSSVSALLMFTLLGDVSSASSLAASVPTVLVQAKYSRDFEREADSYSYDWLAKQGIPQHRFGDLLKRIEAAQGAGQGSGDGSAMSYFSSHPGTHERARE